MASTSKDPRQIIHSDEPRVSGPPLALLRRQAVTPTELFFVRSHAATPAVDAGAFRLEVAGLVRTPLRLSLADLRARFPRAAVTATLQCAGNRRRELLTVAPIPGEVPWGADGIGTAVWAGVRLRDVLAAAGPAEGAAAGGMYIAFTGLDAVTRLGQTFGYGSSIPLDKALAAEVLLADEMNGAPLPPEHGFPLRVVVPGYIGARSVKWLQHITVQSAPSDNYFQARAYRLFAPQVTAETVNWEAGLMLGEASLNAVICAPAPGEAVAAGPLRVLGYAVAGGSRRVARVDVSPDGGRSWQTAELEAGAPWTWQFWEAVVDVRPGPAELVVRAWDTAANSQPEHLASVWNFKGYMNNAWHRVIVQAE